MRHRSDQSPPHGHQGQHPNHHRRHHHDGGHHHFQALGAMRELLCMIGGRHRGGGGFGSGRFFGGPGGFGGEDGMPRGRKFSSADLQLLLVALLAEAPRHGYELIKILETRSNGYYSPSPGMVYPALTFLDEIGHATALQEGNRKLYSLTDEGRVFIAENRAQADAMLDTLARIGGRMEHVREAFEGLNDADPQASDALHRARHALKHALYDMRGSGAEEARRVAAILDRATAEILKGKK